MNKRRAWNMGILLLVACLFCAHPYEAKALNGVKGDSNPEAALHTVDNRALLVFESEDSILDIQLGTLPTYAIQAQFYDSSGAPESSPLNIDGASYPVTLVERSDPAVAYDSITETWLVVWVDERDGETTPSIYGRRLGSDGAGVGDPFRISNLAGDVSVQSAPSVAFSPASGGRFFITWEDFRNNDFDLYGRYLDSEGALSPSQDILLAATEDTRETAPSVSYDPDNELFTVSYMQQDSGTGMDIWQVKILDGNNGRFGLPRAVAIENANQVNPDAAAGPGTGVTLTVWNDTGVGSGDILGRYSNSTGPIAAPFTIATEGSQSAPCVSWVPARNQWLVSWVVGHFDGATSLAYTTVSADGVPGGVETVLRSSNEVMENTTVACGRARCVIGYDEAAIPPVTTSVGATAAPKTSLSPMLLMLD